MFFVGFKKFDQGARKCLGVAMYICSRAVGRRRWPGAGSVSSGPPALLLEATATQASVPWRCPQLRSPRAPQPCASRATWSWQAGSELRGQIGLEASVIAALISSPSGSWSSYICSVFFVKLDFIGSHIFLSPRVLSIMKLCQAARSYQSFCVIFTDDIMTSQIREKRFLRMTVTCCLLIPKQ